MRLIYGKQDMQNPKRAQENCFLMTNGRGGYASMSAAYSVTRGDQGALISARIAPTLRFTMIQRIREYIVKGEEILWLSSQEFADSENMQEDGYRGLSSFVWDGFPRWLYEMEGLNVSREIFMSPGENTTAILYRITNVSEREIIFRAEPGFVGMPKGQVPHEEFCYRWDGNALHCGGKDDIRIYVKSNASLYEIPEVWDVLAYRDDAGQDRNENGWNLRCLRMESAILPGETKELELILSDQPIRSDRRVIRKSWMESRKQFEDDLPFRDPTARALAAAASDYVVQRDSTGGSTIIAGYPFFADWGRDTMIALEGCVLALNRTDTAKEIIETFLKYEKDGLVPNLFPEGTSEPEYNTADAALLLINSVWSCWKRTGDEAFVRRVYPALERIIEGYRRGTGYEIHMDADGLICAGKGLDQVTWMDVCVDGILPTPRHGKPVEINAYWYNALKVMGALASVAGVDGTGYETLAERTKESFLCKFPLESTGGLKDVLSGTEADYQIRCNQIWAVTMPFSMLSREQECRVTELVYRELYTPCGLRTLSMKDPQFHPTYGGTRQKRDMAYHQGTVWIFPLGAFYRAWLKVHDYSAESKQWVRERLDCLIPMLREGCVGQLPEIYDGAVPGSSRGCFAQAWSVGELLTVFELLESEARG